MLKTRKIEAKEESKSGYGVMDKSKNRNPLILLIYA